jgi:hypothetical protein
MVIPLGPIRTRSSTFVVLKSIITLSIKGIITRSPDRITTTMGPRTTITTRPRTTITQGTGITPIMTDPMVGHITGMATGGMPIFN